MSFRFRPPTSAGDGGGSTAVAGIADVPGLQAEIDSLSDRIDANVAGHAAPPDDSDDGDATHFYFGWQSYDGGGWRIIRQTRATGQAQTADSSSNPDQGSFTAAWVVRVNLMYGEV